MGGTAIGEINPATLDEYWDRRGRSSIDHVQIAESNTFLVLHTGEPSISQKIIPLGRFELLASKDQPAAVMLIRAVRELWILSEMLNETRALHLPSLLASGTENVLAKSRQAGLIVPLKGYKVHVVGASTQGFTPQYWNTVKAFWTEYFRQCEAELVVYSSEVITDR